MRPVVQIDIDEYQKLKNLANLSDEQIQRMAERMAQELFDKNRSEVMVRIYMKSDVHDSIYEDRADIAVVPEWSVSEQLEPLANKVRYWAYDTLSEIYAARIERYSDKKRAEYFESKSTRQLLVIFLLLTLLAIILIFK